MHFNDEIATVIRSSRSAGAKVSKKKKKRLWKKMGGLISKRAKRSNSKRKKRELRWQKARKENEEKERRVVIPSWEIVESVKDVKAREEREEKIKKETEEKRKKAREERAEKEQEVKASKVEEARLAAKVNQPDNSTIEQAKEPKGTMQGKKNISVLFKNGLMFQTNGNHFCILCDVELSKLEINNHVTLESHSLRLAIFKHHFRNQHLNILCTSCDSTISFEKFTSHAQHHRILPWHRPIDLSQRFYNNQVVRWGDTLYCYPCQEMFSDWAIAYSHTSRLEHRNLLIVPQASQEVQAGFAELAVRNAVFAVDTCLMQCKMCSCQIIGEMSSLVAHVTGPRHKAAELGFSTFLLNAGKSDLMKKNAIQRGANGTYWCGLCSLLIQNLDQVAIHVKEKDHRENDILKARSEVLIRDMRSTLLNRQSPEQTTRNVAAQKPTGRITGIPKIPEISAIDRNCTKTQPRRVSQQVSRDYLQQIDNVTHECNLCDCDVRGGRRNVSVHLCGKKHNERLSKYRCDLIDIVKPDIREYRCNACDCQFSGCHNLRTHTLGSRHIASVASLENQLAVETEKKRSLADEKSVVYDDDRSILNNEKSIGKNRNVNKWRNTKQKYTNAGPHKYSVNEKTECDVCRVKFPNELDLHAHMAAHYSLKFMTDRGAAKKEFLNSEACASLVNNGRTAQDEDGDLTSSDELEEEEADKTSVRQVLSQMRKVMNTQKITKIVAILSSENNELYTMKDKLREFELATRLSFEVDGGKIYCLVCGQQTEYTIDNYFEHLISLNHSVWLERMERDHARFEKFPDQFSEIDLCMEYMEERGDRIYCYSCRRPVDEINLRSHIGSKRHVQARTTLRDLATWRFDHLTFSYNCSWYKVQLYCCIPCLKTFRYEANFTKHLASSVHANCMQAPPNTARQLVFDFCENCALLWYGYRRTAAYHRLIGSHRFLECDGHYRSVGLTDEIRQLLGDPKVYIDEFVERCENANQREREKEAMIVRDIEIAVGDKYPGADAHLFGSRVTGLGSLGCDIDIFLDCGNMYSGSKSSHVTMLKLIHPVAALLKKFPERWVIKELLTSCRSPIIKAYHKVTELDCDISFENGLAVENTKLIRSYNECFPLCRQMIIFVKRWAKLCGLTGTRLITSYALYWLVIFYLQHASILPTVAELIAKRNNSRKIDGWEVGVSRGFTCNKTKTSLRLIPLLIEFFRFWGNFDYRHDVACPLIGRALKKLSFISGEGMPAEMGPYNDYLGKKREGSMSEIFRIDSTMCIQDPFDLQHNLTKAVSKVYVNRFREYCNRSYEFMGSV